MTPYGWRKINVDLNSSDDGKDGFGEPTFLFIKEGYKGDYAKLWQNERER